MMLQALREEVCELHMELPRNNLVVWTMGNVSARDPETNLVVIKPSGVKFQNLTPDKMVIVDIDGNVVEGYYKTSSDTASHCYIYRHMPHVRGVVHTHSRYATAFAALGREIPCFLTGMGDEFGGPIPCASFALIGGEEIGQLVVQTLTGHKSRACLLQNHGVFTIAKPRRRPSRQQSCARTARRLRGCNATGHALAHLGGEPGEAVLPLPQHLRAVDVTLIFALLNDCEHNLAVGHAARSLQGGQIAATEA
jgi:L-ribulose-5-phosphate 4-epimerase